MLQNQTPTEAFLDAHERHWEDAELLFGNARWANADHLYGVSAECGIKAVIEAFGGCNDKDHLEQLKKPLATVMYRFEITTSGHAARAATRYTYPDAEFDGWKIEHRYYQRSLFNSDGVAKRQAGANKVRQMVLLAKVEGRIAS